MDSPLRIDQALHGYQDGHRLLATSIELPAESERIMLALTDGPDRHVGVPSSGYLSGYRVPGLDVFALARTWAAPEMPRPGCVWTHSLLIPLRVLGEIEQPSALLPLFRRPQAVRPDRDQYRHGLVVAQRELSSSGAWHLPTQLLESSLYWLYSQSKPVVAAGGDELQSERLVLDIWGQQWPRLRARFSFASIPTTRDVAGRAFDLRVIPEGSDPLTLRAFTDAVLADVETPTPRDISARWLGLALADLQQPGRLRRVLWRYGPGTSARVAFRRLAEVYGAVELDARANQSIAEVVGLLATSFPRAEQMRPLKRDILGASLEHEALAQGGLSLDCGESELLVQLVTTPDQSAFLLDDFGLSTRAAELWSQDRLAALELLDVASKHSDLPLAAEALGGLLPLAIREPDALVRHAPAAVPLAIGFEPKLAADARIWKGKPVDIQDRWEAVGTTHMAARLRRGVVYALLMADTPGLIEPAFSRWGVSLVGDVLDIAGDDPAVLPLSPAWLKLLRANSGGVSAWVRRRHRDLKGAQFLLVADVADPADFRLDTPSSDVWLRAVEDLGRDERQRLGARALAFLFCLGLRARDPSSSELVARTFGPLRRALLDGSAESARELLGREIPMSAKQLAPSKKKDRPDDPTTYALARRWKDERWAIADLVDYVDDPRLITEVIAALMNWKSGSKLVNEFIESHGKTNRAMLADLLPSDWEKLAGWS